MEIQNKKVRTRFAPSPTGDMHVGNVRTALFAWLFARHHNGSFVLRIEDTDKERAVQGGVESILESFKWLGLDIDEGVVSVDKEKGDLGPYIQSNRLDIYQKHAKKLVDEKNAFYCFCTQKRLEKLREAQKQQKLPPKYDGHCLKLDSNEVEEKISNKEEFVIRMKIPETGEIVFKDCVKGDITIQNSTIDYQILLKSDGFPTYHLASVVDDHLMEITHVIRADEWIASTPKHILLYKYFGWEEPKWIHLPIILGADKSKLSKRHGAVSLLDYKKIGYLPNAMVNFLALQGWNPKTNQEILSKQELIKQFEVEKINKNNPIFETQKLDWMNKQYIKNLDPKDIINLIQELDVLTNQAKDFLKDDELFKKTVTLAQDRMSKINDFEELISFLWSEKLEYDKKILIPKNLDKTQTQDMLKSSLEIIENIKDEVWTEENLRRTFFEYTEKNNIKKGDMLWPLRVAVTGLEKSPDVFGVMNVLGVDVVVKRVQSSISKLTI